MLKYLVLFDKGAKKLYNIIRKDGGHMEKNRTLANIRKILKIMIGEKVTSKS